jgi:hypothetical protein
VQGDLQALIEQRPTVRRQWSAGLKAILHHAASDGALHLGYGQARDAGASPRSGSQAEWLQPLVEGRMLALRLRYHTPARGALLRAAAGVAPGLPAGANRRRRQPVITSHDPALLPAHFSSDARLAGFGTLGAGLGLHAGDRSWHQPGARSTARGSRAR